MKNKITILIVAPILFVLGLISQFIAVDSYRGNNTVNSVIFTTVTAFCFYSAIRLIELLSTLTALPPSRPSDADTHNMNA